MSRVLGIGGALIGALVIYLFIEVQAEPGVDVDEGKIAAARSEAQSRAVRGRARERTSRDTAPAPVARASKAKDKEKDEGDDDSSPPVAVTGMSMSIDTSAPTFDENTPFVDKVKEARRLYGRRRYEQAYDLALELLKEEPKNRRVLRVAVAAACIMARPDAAAEHFEQLSYPKDKTQMRRRCKAYGVELPGE